jgi:O-methyltransferase involved in polyketide biosynthesis
MPEKNAQNLSGVSETLLLPLYNRAMESQRPDAMLKDEKALELVTQMRLDFSELETAYAWMVGEGL